MEDFHTATVFERFALSDILEQVPEALLNKAIDLLESGAVHIRKHKKNDASGHVEGEKRTFNVTILTTSSRLYALCTCKAKEYPFCEHSIALLLAIAETNNENDKTDAEAQLALDVAILLEDAPLTQTRRTRRTPPHRAWLLSLPGTACQPLCTPSA